MKDFRKRSIFFVIFLVILMEYTQQHATVRTEIPQNKQNTKNIMKYTHIYNAITN